MSTILQQGQGMRAWRVRGRHDNDPASPSPHVQVIDAKYLYLVWKEKLLSPPDLPSCEVHPPLPLSPLQPHTSPRLLAPPLPVVLPSSPLLPCPLSSHPSSTPPQQCKGDPPQPPLPRPLPSPVPPPHLE